jgi:O-antigen/teichoic acid export membrane protein
MICRRRYVHASATYALSDGLRALCFVIPVLLGWGLHGLFIGAAIAMGSRVVAMLWYFNREFGKTLRPDGAVFKSQLHYALPFGGALLVEIIQRNYHQYFISNHFDPATFAIYAAGCLTIPFIDFVATPSSDVMMVKMREAHANGDTRAVLALWHDTTGKLSLLFFPLVVFSIIVSRELIITLYTKTYAASIPVFAFWSLAIVFTAVMVDGVLRVYAQTRFLLINNLIKLGLTAVLLLWFVQSFQLVGAVLATLLTTLVGRILGLWRMKHVMAIRWKDVLPWTRMGIITLFSIAAGVPAIVVKSGFQSSPKVALLVTCGIYGLAYWALALSFHLVRLPDLGPVWTTVRKLRTRLPVSKADTTAA